MKRVSKAVNMISEALQVIELYLGVFCLFSLFTVMMVNVFMRYLLTMPLFWADEVTNYLFVWFAFLGIAYMMGSNGHLRMTSLLEKMAPGKKKIVTLLVDGIMLILFAIFAVSSITLLGKVTFSGILRIPLKYIYLILPLSFGLSCFHILNNMLQYAFDGKPSIKPIANETMVE